MGVHRLKNKQKGFFEAVCFFDAMSPTVGRFGRAKVVVLQCHLDMEARKELEQEMEIVVVELVRFLPRIGQGMVEVGKDLKPQHQQAQRNVRPPTMLRARI